jgi:hypothetical protein
MTPTPTPIQLLKVQIKCYKYFRDQHINDLKRNSNNYAPHYRRQLKEKIKDWQTKIDRYEKAVKKLTTSVKRPVGTPSGFIDIKIVPAQRKIVKRIKSKSIEQLTEKYYGKKGTPKRDKYDKEVQEEIKKEQKKQSKKSK